MGLFALQSDRCPQPAAGTWSREGNSVPRSYRSGTKDTGVVQKVPRRTVEQLPSKNCCLKCSLGHYTGGVSYSGAIQKACDSLSAFKKVDIRT